MANKVLAGYVTRICEIYIDDVTLFGATDDEYLDNTCKVLMRLRDGRTGTSVTSKKLLQVLDFPLPITVHRAGELFSRS